MLVPGKPIHSLKNRRALQRREGEQQQEGGDELGPHEERQPGTTSCRVGRIKVFEDQLSVMGDAATASDRYTAPYENLYPCPAMEEAAV